MKRAVLSVVSIVLALLLGGCAGRNVVVPKSAVKRLNDPAWRISSEPAPAPSAAR